MHDSRKLVIRVASRRLAAQTPNLLPVMDPLFNLREACKQMCLLEDHLLQPRKRCIDCVTKHFLTLEALFEEAASLDHEDVWAPYIEGNAERMRGLANLVMPGSGEALGADACIKAAHALRLLRKAIMPETRALKVASGCPHRQA